MSVFNDDPGEEWELGDAIPISLDDEPDGDDEQDETGERDH